MRENRVRAVLPAPGVLQHDKAVCQLLRGRLKKDERAHKKSVPRMPAAQRVPFQKRFIDSPTGDAGPRRGPPRQGAMKYLLQRIYR
jgi:hypothetical protein